MFAQVVEHPPGGRATTRVGHIGSAPPRTHRGALEDLREVIGVLRAVPADDDQADGVPERPQPTLVDLPMLPVRLARQFAQVEALLARTPPVQSGVFEGCEYRPSGAVLRGSLATLERRTSSEPVTARTQSVVSTTATRSPLASMS